MMLCAEEDAEGVSDAGGVMCSSVLHSSVVTGWVDPSTSGIVVL
jgi:hypothetical protein